MLAKSVWQGLSVCTRANGTDIISAEGSRPNDAANSCSGYPRKSNSSSDAAISKKIQQESICSGLKVSFIENVNPPDIHPGITASATIQNAIPCPMRKCFHHLGLRA